MVKRMRQKKFIMKISKRILPICSLLILLLLFSTLSINAEEIYPPAPQMEEIYPPTNTVVNGEIDFIFDFNDKEEDIDYLQIDIIGPNPYDFPITKIQLILYADEFDPLQNYNSSTKDILTDMGISVQYHDEDQQWNVLINTDEQWNNSNPWSQPIGSQVWPMGIYNFFIKARDSNDNIWGGELSYGSYCHYTYSFHSIQNMINMVTEPSEIYVLGTTFYENILFNKSDINLNGLSHPIIDGMGSSCIHVINDNVTINGFIIENSSDSDGSEIGIHCDNNNNVTIINNEIYKHNFGIILEDCTNVEIRSNDIHENWIPTTHTSYQDCLNGGVGINVITIGSGNFNHTIEDNKIYNNHRQGLYIGSSDRNFDDSSSTQFITINDNQINNNGLTWSVCSGFPGGSGDEYGLYLSAADNCVIGPNNRIYDHNKWSDGAGIFLQNSRSNSILSNMMMTIGNSSLMANGKIEYNSMGIILFNNSVNNEIHSNDIENNSIGIRIYDSTNGIDSALGNQITYNNIVSNSQYGIAYGLGGSPSTVVAAQQNWWGSGLGPYNPGLNPSGIGDTVTNNVNFSDWLTFEWWNIMWVDNYYDDETPGWNVTHFDTITKGLEASFPYGIIRIKSGTYKEVLRIDKPISLDSSFGAEFSVISDEDSTYSDMQHTNGQTICIASNNVVINDLTVLRTSFTSFHPMAAIGTIGEPGLSNIFITNNTIESFGNCTRFEDAEGLKIVDNVFAAQTDDCLSTFIQCENINMYNNTLNDYTLKGIYLEDCNDALIYKNSIDQKAYKGIELIGCDNVTLSDSSFDYNYDTAIDICSSGSIVINDNDFSNCPRAIEAGGDVFAEIFDNEYSNVNRPLNGLACLTDEEIYCGDIQDAINLSRVGGLIVIYPGHFYENILINKKIELFGNGTVNQSIIHGESTAPTILIGGNGSVKNTVIDGISIEGGLHCVQTERYKDISGLTIQNCLLSGSVDSCICLDPHNYSDIPPIREGTDIFSSAVVLKNNIIRGGIYYRFHTFEVYGIDINTQLKMIGNDIDTAYLDGSIGVLINNNLFHSLGLTYSNDVQISNNIFENPWEERYGLYLWSLDGLAPVKDVNISHNTITGYSSFAVGGGVSGQGIVIAGALNVDILNNHILANTDGIWITEEYINRNGELCIGDVLDVTIKNNDIQNGQNGIRLTENVSMINIDSNNININGKGIWLHQSCDHKIANNSFIGNYYGIRIDDGSDDNLIYNNIFRDNFISAFDPYSTSNIWNISKTAGTNIMGGPYVGGNYWDDYLGDDIDGDGIGDDFIPYNASGEIVNTGDYLPLVFTDDVSPTVTVTFPNGGEVLSGDISIRWTATDDIDPSLSIDIEYSANNGVNWTIISPNEDNDGVYVWNTSLLDEGTDYLIRITATDSFGNIKSDTSDSTFSIYRDFPGPQLSLNHPQMGYVYFFGLQKLRFLSQNCFAIGHLIIEAEVENPFSIEKVEFYIDDSLMHVEDESDDGIYDWKWDEPVLFTHEVKVIAYDIHGAFSEEAVEVTIFNFNIIP